MSAAESDALVAALARATVEKAAPEELPLFRATSEAYFKDPEALERSGGKDEMLGFGVDAAMVLMTPVVLQVAKDVIGFLGEQLRERAREQGEGAIDRVIARLVNRNGEGEARAGGGAHGRAARAGARARDQEGPSAQALRRARNAARGLAGREPGDGMSAGAAAPERRPRLNPFAFPSDTAFRFGLLVAAVLGANLYVWQWIAEHDAVATRTLAGARALPAIALTSRRHEHRAVHGRIGRILGLRQRTSTATRSWWMLGGTAALLVAAARDHARDCRSGSRGGGKLRPLTADDAPAVVEEVARTGRASRVSTRRGSSGTRSTRPPADLRSATRAATRSLSAAAWSSSRRPTRLRSARSSATSSRTSGTATSGSRTSRSPIWYAFLLVAVVPFVVTLLGDTGHDLRASPGASPFSRALVYLTRNAVLRSREVYADLRASVPDGPDGALRRVLGGSAAAGDRDCSAGSGASIPIQRGGSPPSTTRDRSSRSARSWPSRPA